MVHGVIPLQMQSFTFSLVDLHKFPPCPLLQPVDVLLNGSTNIWCIHHSPKSRFILLWFDSVPLSTSLLKRLNSIRLSSDPWSTPPVTFLQLGFFSTYKTCWAWLFSQFSLHLNIRLSNPYFVIFSMTMSWETLTKVFIKSPSQSPKMKIRWNFLVWKGFHRTWPLCMK